MKKNLGSADRAIRLILAILLLSLCFAGIVEGVLFWVISGFAVVLVATAAFSFCALYSVLGFDTYTKKQAIEQ